MKINQPGYYWCSVGGNPLEICEVTQEKGTQLWAARTIGCPDPFYLNDPHSALVLYTVKDSAARSEFQTSSAWDSYYLPQPISIPTLPEHMGGKKRIPAHSHSWRGPRDWS